jgi:hypothetical protein
MDQVCYERQATPFHTQIYEQVSIYCIVHSLELKSDMEFSVMPVLSYNMLSGPWRDTWILYGFDPRREPDTYQ